MTNEQRSRDVSRRGVLKGTAIAGTAAMTGTAGAYRDEIDFRLPATQNDGEGRTLSLLGIVGGWVGVAPAEIDGVSNPPLRLIEGEENEIVWTNGDGSHHNFTVADEDGEVIEASEFIEEQGESISFTITAEEEMAEYYCQPHPVQMRGPIELIDPDEVHELRVRVEDEEGEPLGAEVFVGDMHSFSDIVARPDPTQEGEGADGGEDTEELEPGDDEGEGDDGGNNTSEETDEASFVQDEEDENGGEAEEEETPADEDAPAVARFDMLEDGEHEVEVWTYGHERVTETVEIDGDDEEVTITLPAIEPGDPAETYSLTLEEGQWVGQEPEEIADEANPTLEVESGESYAVEWENGIGRHQPEAEGRTYEPLPGHNFAIASDGATTMWNTYVRSNFLAEEGDTQTVEFVAEEDMAVYLDQSQLDAVGEIAVDGEAGETSVTGDETGGEETTEPDGNETAETDDDEMDGMANETAEVNGNETAEVDGNETDDMAGNETDGNETAETD